MRKLIGFAILFAAATVAVSADTKIEFKATENGGSSMNSILIGQGKIRSDADQNTTVIIDPGVGAMTMIDRTKKTYTTITRADLNQMTQMLAQLEQQMGNMPPEMRQMMQGRMAGMGGGQAPAVVTDTGQTATVAGKSCRIFKTTQGERTTAETCMADPAALDIPAADRATVTAAMAWAKELTDTLAKAPMMGQLATASPFRNGLVPIRSTTIETDGTRKTSELVGVSNSALPGDTFAIPAGFKEQKLAMPGRGRGGN
jgi:uncharacterized protein DUF4412